MFRNGPTFLDYYEDYIDGMTNKATQGFRWSDELTLSA